jgi:putative ABC transport system permease protein
MRKPMEGLLTFLAVAAGFTLLALMISMNLTTHAILDHSRMDRLIVDTRFYSPTPPQGLPLALGQQIAQLDGVGGVAPYRWLGGYHVDPHQSLGIRMVDANMRAMWSEEPITTAQWDRLLATPTGILVSVKAAAKWGVRPGDVFTLTTQPRTRADGGTSWEFQVLAVVPDDLNIAGDNGFLIGNSQYVENTAPRDQRGADYYFFVRVKNADQAVAVSQRIDDRYANSNKATQTFQQHLDALQRANRGFDSISMTLAIGGTGFLMVLFLTANAIARSVRERVPEFAVLKTLGFRGNQLMYLVFIETAIPCVLGAALGTAIAGALGRWSTHLLSQDLVRMLTTSTPLLPVLSVAIALAVLLALSSCALPMLRLRQLSVTDALAGR